MTNEGEPAGGQAAGGAGGRRWLRGPAPELWEAVRADSDDVLLERFAEFD